MVEETAVWLFALWFPVLGRHLGVQVESMAVSDLALSDLLGVVKDETSSDSAGSQPARLLPDTGGLAGPDALLPPAQAVSGDPAMKHSAELWEQRFLLASEERDEALGECGRLREQLELLERRFRSCTDATLGLLCDARNDRDEARDLACKLLYIAEARGPKVFGPRPRWLKPDPEGRR